MTYTVCDRVVLCSQCTQEGYLCAPSWLWWFTYHGDVDVFDACIAPSACNKLFRRNIFKAIHIQYFKNSAHTLSMRDLRGSDICLGRDIFGKAPRDNHITGQTHSRKSNCGQSQTTYDPWSRKSRYLRITNFNRPCLSVCLCMCVSVYVSFLTLLSTHVTNQDSLRDIYFFVSIDIRGQGLISAMRLTNDTYSVWSRGTLYFCAPSWPWWCTSYGHINAFAAWIGP
jgi:hypothetical protein